MVGRWLFKLKSIRLSFHISKKTAEFDVFGPPQNYVECEWQLLIFLYFRKCTCIVPNLALIFLISVSLAILIPRLGLFISLLGALCLSILGLLFPAIIEICVSYPDNYGRFYHVILKCSFIILLGLFAFGSGTYRSIQDIVLSFRKS